MGAQFAVDLVFKALGADRIKRTTRDIDKLDDAVRDVNGRLRDSKGRFKAAENSIRKTGRAAGTATANFQRLGIAFRTTLLPITALLGTFTLMNRALNTTGQRGAELASLRNGLRGLVDDGNAAADALLKIADAGGKATLFNEEDFTATFKLLTSFRNIGVDSYERVSNAAADLAQVTGQDMKSASMQLAKALEDPARRVTDLARSGTVFTEQQKEQIKALQQSGKLLEAQNLILKEIEAQYGGAAKAAGSAGYAGALDSLNEKWRDFLEAIGKASEAGAVQLFDQIGQGLDFLTRNIDKLGAVSRGLMDAIKAPFVGLLEGINASMGPTVDFEQTFRQSMAVVGNALKVFGDTMRTGWQNIGYLLGESIKWFGTFAEAVSRAMWGAADAVVKSIRVIANALSGLINLVNPLRGLLRGFGIDVGEMAAGPLRNFANGLTNMISSAKGEVVDFQRWLGQQGRFKVETESVSADPFAGAGPKGASGVAAAGGGKAGGDTAALKAQRDAQRAREKALATTLEQTAAFADQLRSLEDQKAILEAKLNGTEREARLQIQIRDAVEGLPEAQQRFVEAKLRGIDALEQEVKKQQELADELTDSEKLAKNVYGIFSGSMQSAIKGLINGTKDLNDVLSDLLGKLGDLFLSMAFNGLGSALKIPGFASGGRPEVGAPSIVGENGPELFVPDQPGKVIPHGETQGVLARYRRQDHSMPAGAGEQQTEEGGSAGGLAPINISTGPVMQFEGRNYVSQEDFQAGIAKAAKDGAKGGEMQTMRRLRMDPGARRRVGI